MMTSDNDVDFIFYQVDLKVSGTEWGKQSLSSWALYGCFIVPPPTESEGDILASTCLLWNHHYHLKL